MAAVEMRNQANVSLSEPIIEELIDKHRHEIRRFIARRSGRAVLKKVTIDDLFQETVTEALSSRYSFQYQGDASFLAWISTIARRVISKTIGSDQFGGRPLYRIRRPHSSGVGVSESQLPPVGRTPSSLAAGYERKDAMTQAIATLPPHYRTVLSLYKLEEMPLTEVASRMGRTKGATCRLLARALAALRETMSA